MALLRHAVAAGLLAAAAAAPAAERWLVVGASGTAPQAVLQQALPGTDLPMQVVAVADCGDTRRVYAWAALADGSAQAKDWLAQLRQRVPAAYLRPCRVRAGSLLALGLPAVDPSIGGVPDTVVNWTDADRVSNVQPLGGGAALVLQRRYEAAPDDPLEGRRTRVLLAQPPAAPVELLAQCAFPGTAVRALGLLALACASGTAADQVLHTVHVFSAAGAPLTQVPDCRQPRISAPKRLACQAESVDAQGRLRLQARTVVLP